MDLLNFLHDKITEEDTFHYCITDILRTRAENEPERTAYIFLRDGEDDEERITYSGLYDTSRAIAESIRKVSNPGERALMLYPPGLDFVKALYACFYAGLIAVPAYPPRKNRSLNRIKSIVRDSQASLVLATNQIKEASYKNFSDELELKNMDWLLTEEVSTNVNEKSMDWQKPDQLDIALLQYTSGSTGTPKGVMVSHKNIMRNSEFLRQCFSLHRKSVSVCWLPSFHDMGLVEGVIQPLYTGFLGVLIPPVAFLQRPYRWLKAMTKYKGTHGGSPNFAFDLCVEKVTESEMKELDLTTMHTLYNGAEPIRYQTVKSFIERFQQVGFRPQAYYPTYGMAETTLIISGGQAEEEPVFLPLSKEALENNKIIPSDPEDPDTNIHVSVGHPWIDTHIKIVDPESKKECKADEVGEIWISGSIITQGYWNNHEDTEETYNAYISDNHEGPFLRTGDLGFFNKGELYVSGRLKDLIIIRGRNIYPQDIELLVENCHESIRPSCSAAFSLEVEGVEKLFIIAELERTFMRKDDFEDVYDAIRESVYDEFELEAYGIILIRTASIPKTSSGKIQRKATKKEYLEDKLSIVSSSILDDVEEESGETQVTKASLQSWLIAWISINLKIGIEKINPQRPIVAYGLNSIKAIMLRNDFLKTYGVDFPPYLFFEKMSIEETAGKALELIKESGE